MATQVFTDEELERLREFPEIGRDELVRFFTLTLADVAFVDPGRGRGPADRLGLAVALSTLPWLGFVPGAVVTAPAVAVARLAEQLQVDPTALRSYGRRAKTRTDHLRLVAQYLGWRAPGAAPRRPPRRRPGAGPHLPGPFGEHQLLRRDRGRHRRRACPARPDRLPAIARGRHPVLSLLVRTASPAAIWSRFQLDA